MKKVLQKILFQILWSLKNIIVHPQNSLFHLPGLFSIDLYFCKKKKSICYAVANFDSEQRTNCNMNETEQFFLSKKYNNKECNSHIFFCLLGLFKNVQILSIWLWLHIDTVSRVFRFSFFGYSFAVTGHFFVQWSMGRMGWDATFIRYATFRRWRRLQLKLFQFPSNGVAVWLQAGRRVG